ncbi:fasciclin domain-containing protein [Ascidiimonas aurantiaca]|uniref:fasciclin domain-containing protein n=1 Tax=Ascidiimonas aurantiaca TaxID=1685432 RepID=UPI0030EEFF5D
MKKHLPAVLLLCFIFLSFFNSCSSDNSEDTTTDPPDNGGAVSQTLTAYFESRPEYSILSEAIEQIGFSQALDNPSSFTFFAPDNDAFERYLSQLQISNVKSIPTGLLTQIIQYHMLSGARNLDQLTAGYTNTLAKEFSSQAAVQMYFTKVQGQTRINNAFSVSQGNIEATNGTIHKVNEVLDLPTVATFLKADPQLNSMALALDRESTFSFLTELADRDRDFTLFVPSATAFGNVLEELSYSDLNAVPKTELEGILNTHIHLNSIKRQMSLTNDMTIEMKNGSILTIRTGANAGITDGNGRDALFSVYDIQAWNGVIHVVSTVMLP